MNSVEPTESDSAYSQHVVCAGPLHRDLECFVHPCGKPQTVLSSNRLNHTRGIGCLTEGLATGSGVCLPLVR